ncbi:hypothetical protein BELL_0581g00030 [Botrytis elliptica]|uniref:Peptidase M14 domain-containing protein n=1 Tax=Botrytis elliptica TaxID=278938 RepID=A0A4Z1JCG9_9HELO|nr:hypothetical protein BELL_0581g00030 [Botrytis elliptica]
MKLSQIFTLATAAAAAGVAIAEKVNYDGYKVFRLKAQKNNIEKIDDIVSSLNLQTWKKSAKLGTADVVVPPEQVDNFLRITEDFSKQVMHNNLGESIAEEEHADTYSIEAALAPNATWFTAYHAYADHIQFLKDLVTAHPSNAEIVTAGTSIQGNPITGIHIYGSSGKGVKPAVLFHGTVHAREWITTLTVEYMAYNLLSNYASSTEIKGFVDKYDYYIFPVVNPDGFLYTQSTNRLWRKNRQTPPSSSTCYGRDINRNWEYKWSTAGGASTDPCAEDYRGVAAADAQETKALAAYSNKIKAAQGLKLFIDFHSYSQLMMSPYGYSCTALPENNAKHQSLAAGYVAAVKAVYGTVFTYGPICSTIYAATGNSVDYHDATVGADFSFTTELRDTGTYGFVLPATQITPSVIEAYAGSIFSFVVSDHQVKALIYLLSSHKVLGLILESAAKNSGGFLPSYLLNMWLRKAHMPRCVVPSTLPARHFRPNNVSISLRRGITRKFSQTCKAMSSSESPIRAEPTRVENNTQSLNNFDSAHASHPQNTAETETNMGIYRVVKDSSPDIVTEKRMEDTSGGIQQESDAHLGMFTKFLNRLEGDGYTAFKEPSPYNAATQLITTLETKPNPISTQIVPEVDAIGEEQVQVFANSLPRNKDFLGEPQKPAAEKANGYQGHETANTSPTASQDMEMPRRIDQTITICLHLDEKVTKELDRTVAKYSQYTPIMNNGRANVAVIKGLPVQNWRQYQVFMRFLQFWRSPFNVGRVKPAMTRLGRYWEVYWQIEDIPEISTIRQTFRRVLEDDLPHYNFAPDALWEARAVLARGLSRTQAREVVDSINIAHPDGIDLGMITRCVLVHTIFSYSKVRTTVTQSPEFPLMGVGSDQLSHDANEHTEIKTLWNRLMSHIDTIFFKASKSSKFYKTAPSRRPLE